MSLKTIFSKPVDRTIEGVIKADDEASLRLEIEEYVLTNEVEKRLESFLDGYNNYENANGVWVSGFFGSGKSHLLKMLALLLENRKINGVSSLDLFLPKCGDNEILRGDLKRAVTIPSKSILFNIDQKADVISKTQVDALLAVFVKVFDEMCGYYGKQGHIAQFERDLDSRGFYDRFKSDYASFAGRTWQKGREQALLEGKNIAKAYAKVTGGDEASALGILDKYRSQYRVSIEDFAEQINAYIKCQPPGFRLNFFVDEVGQYIADNVKLMTNLQTIAESLATKCQGNSWIIVTAQEDMSSVLGDMSKQQGNDFSKIQARFSGRNNQNRMKLTSADVAEVIQKRLLTKTEEGVRLLSDIYHAQSNHFKTLFDFADGSKSYRNFRDREHFIHCYPFVPYQFDLFQSAIQNLSLHNAFEGKHSSVGERSMLGVFQQVAIQISGHETGQLATFDRMFGGIRTVVKSQIQRAIIQAEKHLDNTFAIRMLKTLFLVKYIKEFKPTIRNLCVLMLEHFGLDLTALRKQVEEALNLLESQTYIQRNGEYYEYLTDEEKDVEQEIKNTEVESSVIADELDALVFDQVVKHKKIRHDDSGQDYSFARKLDDRLHGRDYELAVHVISPFHENAENESILQMQNMGRDELLVLMPPDVRLMRDLTMYKRTDKYIRQNTITAQQESIKRILTDKGYQNNERYAGLKQHIQGLLGKARLFVAGQAIEPGSGDAQARIVNGFQELVARVYPNLRMLRGVTYTENEIANCLRPPRGGLFESDGASLTEPEQEVLALIQSNSRGGVRTTLKGLLERFERKPYGWYYAAILCILAKLCARGKLEVRTDSNLLEEHELEPALRNTRLHGNILLEPQVQFTASQVRALKEFYEDFFDGPPRANEAKSLGKEMVDALRELIDKLTPLAAQVTQYPFLTALAPVMEKLRELAGKPYTWHLTELIRQEDVLLDMKENIINPILKFMGGSQKDIFDQVRTFVQNQKPNFSYIRGDEIAAVTGVLTDPDCYKGNRMPAIKTQLEALEGKIKAHISQELDKARQAVADSLSRLTKMPEFTMLTQAQKDQIRRPFDTLTNSLNKQPLVAVIRDTLRQFEESEYPRQLSQMTAWAIHARPAAQKPGSAAHTDSGQPEPSQPQEPQIDYVTIRSLRVVFDKPWLADESDIDRYLGALREKLLTEIQEGRRIQI